MSQMQMDVTCKVTPQATPIEFENYESLKSEIDEALDEYRNVVVTETNAKDAKEMRATLRKFRNAITSERIRIQKLCLVDFKTFEAQAKELEKLVDKVIGDIDENIKALDPPEPINTYSITFDCSKEQLKKLLKEMDKAGIFYDEPIVKEEGVA